MEITLRNPLLVFAITLGLLLGTGCAPTSNDEAHVQAMEGEHEGDHPEPSPAATTAPKAEVESSEVHYATLAAEGDDAGTEIRGYLAKPKGASNGTPGVLLIHEWWGLNDNIRAVADRFAGEGYVALAVDLYEGDVADTREGAASLMRGTLESAYRLNDNLRQARDFLVEQAGASKVGSVGWCFGGGWSLNAAIHLGEDLDASVIYYGRVTDDPAKLTRLRAPVLGLFGSLDEGIPIDSVRSFEAALTALGKPAEVHVYEGANHAFANPSGTRYNEAAAKDAWEKTLAFFAAHLG